MTNTTPTQNSNDLNRVKARLADKSTVARSYRSAVYHAASAQATNTQFEKDFDALNPPVSAAENVKSMIVINNESRLEIAQYVDSFASAITNATNSGVDESEIAEIKEQRSSLLAQLNNLPPLGQCSLTMASYKPVKLMPGRKGIELEYTLLRSRDELKEAISELTTFEKEHYADSDVSAKDYLETLETTVGRRKFSVMEEQLSKLDGELRRYYKRALEEMEAFKTYTPMTEFDKQNLKGRAPVSPIVKLNSYLDKITSAMEQIHKMEFESIEGVITQSIGRNKKTVELVTFLKPRVSKKYLNAIAIAKKISEYVNDSDFTAKANKLEKSLRSANDKAKAAVDNAEIDGAIQILATATEDSQQIMNTMLTAFTEFRESQSQMNKSVAVQAKELQTLIKKAS
ncbi:hypothetical protein AB6D11_02995 [Vibrio splendidus]